MPIENTYELATDVPVLELDGLLEEQLLIIDREELIVHVLHVPFHWVMNGEGNASIILRVT